ncbi:gliding motility-associated C-terminal domain-containing protein, partial [Flavobacteriales bacterium]|nr:gliding motility-associated C-terminal domain-containing protein [Flavobacteriales bacterium]
LAISDSTEDVSCNGGNDGFVAITTTGGTPVYSYLWTPVVSTGSTAGGLSAGTYNVDLTDANGCLATTVITVTEPSILSATYGAVNSTCGQCNGSASLTVTGGSGPYSYQWLNGGSNPLAATNLQLCPGNHPVIVTDVNGCSYSLTVLITDEPAPQIDAMLFTPPSCYGGNNGTAEVMSTGGTGVLSYLWDAAAGSQTSSLASGLPAGTYCVTVTDVNNCLVSNCVTITEPAQLSGVPDGTATICYGDSTQIWASGQGGTPGYTINWSTPGLVGTGPIMVSPLTQTDYCFTVEDASGCVSSSSCVTIDVLPALSVDMMPSVSICSGSPVDILASASGGNGGPYEFDWVTGSGVGITPSTTGSPSTITDSPVVDTWYYVTVSDGCSLDATDSVEILIDALPVAFLNVVNASGCAPFTAEFILNTDIGVNFEYDYECDGLVDYSGPDLNTSHTYNSPGLYDVCVTVITATGCESTITSSGIVEVYPVPTAGFSANPWVATDLNPIITFQDESSGALNFEWTFGDGENASGLESDILSTTNTSGTIGIPVHFYNTPGEYTVTQTITNQYGCTDVVSYVVTVNPDQTMFVPNSFTPDGDGINDFFIPRGIGFDNEYFEMYIFDRWGEEIYQTRSISLPWDGTVKGGTVMAQTDVYIWLIKAQTVDGQQIELKGHVTLLK